MRRETETYQHGAYVLMSEEARGDPARKRLQISRVLEFEALMPFQLWILEWPGL